MEGKSRKAHYASIRPRRGLFYRYFLPGLERFSPAAGFALVKGYTSTGPDDPLPTYTLSPADVGKFRYIQGGTPVPLDFSGGEGVIPGS